MTLKLKEAETNEIIELIRKRGVKRPGVDPNLIYKITTRNIEGCSCYHCGGGRVRRYAVTCGPLWKKIFLYICRDCKKEAFLKEEEKMAQRPNLKEGSLGADQIISLIRKIETYNFPIKCYHCGGNVRHHTISFGPCGNIFLYTCDDCGEEDPFNGGKK